MIEPTPALFYQIISEVLVNNASLAAKIINEIKIVSTKDYPSVQTLCIGKDGIIFISKEFWTKWVKTKLDAKTMLLHELFHAVTGDTSKLDIIPKEDMFIANVSMDMRINAAIVNTFLGFTNISNNLNNFILTNLYQETGITGLLRPFSSFGIQSKFKALYYGLYYDKNKLSSHKQEDIEEIFRNEETLRSALKILIPKSQRIPKVKIIFIGNHGTKEKSDQEQKDNSKGNNNGNLKDIGELDEFTRQEIRDALGDLLKNGYKAGYSSVAIGSLIKVLKSNKSINNKFLDQFSCNQKINVLKSFYTKQKRQSSVVPLRPSSRDLVLLAADITPSIWHNIVDIKANKNKNIAIYLDVSGSVTQYLPKLLGIISNLDPGIKSIFCFSNIVSEHTKEELSEGKFQSTEGTDFDCIADHALEKLYNKIIIFTDGYAELSISKRDLVKDKIKDVAIVYFGSHVNRNNYFENEYKKGFTLKELTGDTEFE